MTKNGFIYLVFLLFLQLGFAQNNQLWQGYFSYNDIRDLAQSPTAIFVASENALFSKEVGTNQIKTTTTIDGLSGQPITSLYYSSIFKKTLVGYENGLMIVINQTDGSTMKVVDIINKQLPSNIKRINHFIEYNGIVYVSCDFGIVQFNLSKLLFGDTYFIGNNGVELKVTQTAVFDGYLYASTADGIRKADIANKNLNDYKQWTQIADGSWSSIEGFDTELLAINNSGHIHKYNSGTNSFRTFLQLPLAAVDMRTSHNYLVISTPTSVYLYNKQLILTRQITSSQITESTVTFTSATCIGDTVYIGSKENGMYTTSISVSSAFQNTKPSGPARNNVFALQTSTTSLWAVYGNYELYYNPYPLESYGISKHSDQGWLNIPYEKVFGAKSMVRVLLNPKNENEIYASSYFSGLLKIVDEIPTILYNQTNSELESLTLDQPDPNYIDIRINGTAFDKFGNLWVTNSLVVGGLKTLSTSGQWKSYPMDKILTQVNKNNFCRLSIDKNGTKWMATDKDGVIGFNEKNNVFKKITVGTDAGNLPTTDVIVAVPDNNNQLWIGTTNGLRVLSNVNSFLTENQMTTKPIIILEDNLAQELMYEQFITDIVVDGSNNKWIGTSDSGVFLVSPDGQQTKYHFTETNSPIPSNTINDIDVNSKTGEVFIATNKGLVSFKGTATSANQDLNNVYVYPNPVRPEFEGTVKVTGLLDKATVKITDIQGNLVYETTTEGGTIEWDTTAFGKYKVASGVYMIFISAQDGVETKVKKIMIIR
jgi:hypothetical protein